MTETTYSINDDTRLSASEAMDRLWSLAKEKRADLSIDYAIDGSDGGNRRLLWHTRALLSDKQILSADKVLFDGSVYLRLDVQASLPLAEEPPLGESGFFQVSPANALDKATVNSMWQLARKLAEATNRKILWLGSPSVLVPLNEPDLRSTRRIYRIPARTCPADGASFDAGFWCQTEPENPSDEDYINSTDPPAGIETFLVEAGLTLKEARQKIAEHRTRKSL